MTGKATFVAYPSSPPAIGETLERALTRLRSLHRWAEVTSWPQLDIAGRFLADPIFGRIHDADLLVADITKLNFNVVFEIGFAIGKRKRVFLVQNRALQLDHDLVTQVGLFDTLGFEKYTSSDELAERIAGIADVVPIPLGADQVNQKSPLFLVMPRDITDFEIRIQARIKKSRLRFRSFDPQEEGRLSASSAIGNVAASAGVVVPLLPSSRNEAVVHNMRAAFVIGLAMGMERELLVLQTGSDPVPLDFRDLVVQIHSLDQVNAAMADFVPLVTERIQREQPVLPYENQSRLFQTSLGASAAENEFELLGNYYLRTAEFDRVARGEVQVVAGRKGSGKTALFSQVRDTLRRNTQNVVLDLMPEGYRLLKFKEAVLDRVPQGNKEQLMTALWEYLLLLEVCHKLLHKDKQRHLADHRLFQPYQDLERRYKCDAFVSEGDFAERMSILLDRIAVEAGPAIVASVGTKSWSDAVTQLIYKHDIAALRRSLLRYLAFKESVWILFDNLDKGWPPFGITTDDITSFRCLLDAIIKINNLLRNESIASRGVVFIRNDVFELLVEGSPDRGKIASVLLDWSDPDLLRELLRLRLKIESDPTGITFDQIWRQLCVSHVRGEESAQYLIDRSLMRPRALIDLVQACRAHALNLRKDKIDVKDIEYGEEAYSMELTHNIRYEIRDVFPEAQDAMYGLMGSMNWLARTELSNLLERAGVPANKHERALDLLLWYGVLGFVRSGGEETYIYHAKYDLRRLKAAAQVAADPMYSVNPAFWKGLEIRT